MEINAIYLAAGFSKRFGENKLLHKIGDKPMFQHALERLITVQRNMNLISQLIVVTQYDEIAQYAFQRRDQIYNAACQNSLSSRDTENTAGEIIIVRNEHSERGISSSLQLGLQAAAGADACLFCVADQPYLKEETIAGLISGFSKTNQGIGCVVYGNKCGNPTIFSSRYYGELLKLQGDLGGRKIIESHLTDVYRYQVTNECELKDIDYYNRS